jgi:hypothetical protein
MKVSIDVLPFSLPLHGHLVQKKHHAQVVYLLVIWMESDVIANRINKDLNRSFVVRFINFPLNSRTTQVHNVI